MYELLATTNSIGALNQETLNGLVTSSSSGACTWPYIISSGTFTLVGRTIEASMIKTVSNGFIYLPFSNDVDSIRLQGGL